VRYLIYDSNSLSHHGILGQKWGVRRYQKKDGSLTAAGKKRYSKELKNLAEKYDVNRPHEDFEVQTQLVSDQARDLVRPTWDKQKIIDAQNALKKASQIEEQAYAGPYEQMLKNDSWRKSEATKLAEEYTERHKNDPGVSEDAKEVFDYYYNIKGIDAAAIMSERYYDTVIDSKTRNKMDKATKQYLKLNEEYLSLMNSEVDKALRGIGINELNTDKKTLNKVNRLVRSVIELDASNTPRYVAPDGFWAGDFYITNSSLKKGYNEYLSMWDTPEARSVFGTKKLTEQEFIEELKKKIK